MDTRLDVAFLPPHSISATSCRTHTFSRYLRSCTLPPWWCITPTRSVFPALPPKRAPLLSARGYMVRAPRGTRTAHRRFPCHCRRYCTRNSADSIALVGLGAAPFLLLPFHTRTGAFACRCSLEKNGSGSNPGLCGAWSVKLLAPELPEAWHPEGYE